MNSFSPNTTLSNSKTAVRFAVDFIFNTSMLFLIVVGFLFSLAASAQTKNGAQIALDELSVIQYCDLNPKSVSCLARNNPGGEDYRTRQCAKYVEKITELNNTARKACTAANLGGSNFEKCFDQIKWCANAEEEIENIVSEEYGDEGDKQQGEDSEICDTVLANRCPGLPHIMEGRNYREEEKDAERERLLAKREVDELTKERREAQRDMLKQQRELQEAQQDAAYELRKAEREIAKDMSKQFKDIQEGQKRAFEDAQRAYQEMDAAYVKMRHESRQLALKVEEAKDKFHGQCITQAETQFKSAEKERYALKNKRKKNAGSATRLAGSTKRNSLNQTRLRNFDFNAYLNECLNGQTGVGKSLANGVREAERNKEANDQYLKEQAALIEQQRQTMLKKLMDLEGTTEGQNAEVAKLTNERLQNLSEEQQRIAAKNQARLTEFLQDQQLRLNDIDQRLQTESQQLVKYEQEALVAKRRAICSGRVARKSEASLERLSEGWNSAIGDIENLVSQCNMYQNLCDPVDSTTSDAGKVRVPGSSDLAPGAQQFLKLPECKMALETKSGSDRRLKKRGNWTPDSGRGTSR